MKSWESTRIYVQEAISMDVPGLCHCHMAADARMRLEPVTRHRHADKSSRSPLRTIFPCFKTMGSELSDSYEPLEIRPIFLEPKTID
jgi:hypothetical protein